MARRRPSVPSLRLSTNGEFSDDENDPNEEDSCISSSSKRTASQVSTGLSAPATAPIPLPLHRHYNNPPEISLRVFLPLLYLLEQIHGADAINSIVTAAGQDVGITLSYHELRRSLPDDIWVSISFINRVRGLIFSELYGMKELPERTHPLWQMWREAGIVALQKEGLGSVAFAVLKAFLSPGVLYRNLPFSMRRANTVLNCTILNSSIKGRVEVSMKPNHPDSYKEGHEFCLNRIGLLEAIPMIWGLNMAQVEHTCCMHDPVNPADECRYVVRYQERWLSGILKSLLGLMACVVVAVYIVPLFSASSSFEVLLAMGLMLFLSLDGYRRYISLYKLYQQDQKHMQDITDLYDKRYMDLWNESEQLRRLTLDNRNISAYVPPPLLDRLRSRREQAPRLGGSKREATIMFVDIRNYSTMAERLDPEQTLHVLNECFSAWVKDVQSHGGTVLEFLGDGMLAVFGAPNDIADHPAQAVRCLQTMVHTMKRVNESLKVCGSIKTAAASLSFRGGLHTGVVIAGNLGSATQMKYAVVGDTVNVAARLEQLNKTLGTMIAISGDTYANLPEELKKWMQPKGRHFVKGREQAVEVYAHGHVPLVVPRKERRLSLQALPFSRPLVNNYA